MSRGAILVAVPLKLHDLFAVDRLKEARRSSLDSSIS